MDILIIIATIIVLFILVASTKPREHFTTSSTSDSLHVTVHVRYEYYNMFCREPDAKGVSPKITGVYDFKFNTTPETITEDYNKIKDTIPNTVFTAIHDDMLSIIPKSRQATCKYITAKDIDCHYPDKLFTYSDDEYLFVMSHSNYTISTFADEYSYNYINNAIVTLQSKHHQDVVPLNNKLYLVQTGIQSENLNSVADCQSARLAYRLSFEIGTLYTNPYINMCLVLNTIFYKKNLSFSINGTKITFDGSPDFVISLFVSQEPLCKGIYTLADIKDSFAGICNSLYKRGKGYKYIIDFAAPYESVPVIYDIAQQKDVQVFNTGSQMISTLNSDRYFSAVDNVVDPT